MKTIANNLLSRTLFQASRRGWLLLLAGLSLTALAQSVTGDDTSPQLITQNIALMARIAEYVSIAAGLSLFLGGLFKLKRYGEMRTMMSQQITLAAPLFMILSGGALLYLPLVLGTALYAVWGTTNPMAIPTFGYSSIDNMLPPIVMFVRFVGVVSFIRGWLMVARLGKEAQPGTAGKAMMHIIGGILCIHIVGTAHIIQNLLGFAGA